MIGFIFFQKLIRHQLNSGMNSRGLVASYMMCVQQVLSFLLNKTSGDTVVKQTQIFHQNKKTVEPEINSIWEPIEL